LFAGYELAQGFVGEVGYLSIKDGNAFQYRIGYKF
jgi:hypothetical protein